MARRTRTSKRNPLATFLSGLGSAATTALGAATETIVISAGAIVIDRLMSKHASQPAYPAKVAATAITSPESLDHFLRNHSQAATVVAQLPIVQMGTITGTSTHEVVYQLVTGHRLAVRCLPDGQITFKHLEPIPAQTKAQPPATTRTYAEVFPATDALPVIDCEPGKDGVWEPV